MIYFDFNFDEIEEGALIGSAYLHLDVALAEEYRDVIVLEEGNIDKPVLDCLAVVEFFPDDYGQMYFRGTGKDLRFQDEGLEHDIRFTGYIRYISTHAAILDGIECSERATVTNEGGNKEAEFEYRVASNKQVYGEIGFSDQKTILFQNDFMEMVMRTPKEVKNIFKYQLLSTPEAV